MRDNESEDNSQPKYGETRLVALDEQASNTISRSIALMHAAIEATADGILVSDNNGIIERYNSSFITMWGANSSPLGKHISELDYPIMNGNLDTLSEHLMDSALFPEWQERIIFPDGRIYDVHTKSRVVNGKQYGVVWSFSDITKSDEYERKLSQIANFDPLTGLPNRYQLESRLIQTIAKSAQTGIPFSLMFIDLDHFKTINDTLGHDTGDKLLVLVAERLAEACGRDGFVSRFGGDEFAAVADGDSISVVLKRIKDVMAKPFNVEDQDIWCTVSAGIASYPDDGKDFHTLLRNADAALHSSKQYGRNGWHFFEPGMTAKQQEKMELGGKLRKGLIEKSFRLVWQPKIRLGTGQVYGAEALLRWRDEDGKDIPPFKIIPILEETGLIIPVGEIILDDACKFIRRLENEGIGLEHLSVNLSVRQFRDIELCEKIGRIIETHRIAENKLELEVTESVFADGDISQIVIDTLHSMGILVAIDDFGTGYSNLAYLKDFKLHTLKIDRSFVRDVLVDERDRAMLNAIVSLSKSLGLKTVAEGAETAEQVAYLREAGCDSVQGYYFAKPMEEQQFIDWLKNIKRGGHPEMKYDNC